MSNSRDTIRSQFSLVKWKNRKDKYIYSVISVNDIRFTDKLLLGGTYKGRHNKREYDIVIVKIG
jgi:hypothetical protein